MSFEKAKADLEEKGLGDHVIVLNESSATVAEAAHALGVEPASIAKTLSVLQGEKPVLIVTEGTAKLDNHKYKSLFHIKAKMIPYDEVETYIGHAPGGVCPFGVNEGVEIYLDESLRKFETVYPAAFLCGYQLGLAQDHQGGKPAPVSAGRHRDDAGLNRRKKNAFLFRKTMVN